MHCRNANINVGSSLEDRVPCTRVLIGAVVEPVSSGNGVRKSLQICVGNLTGLSDP